MPDKVTIDKGGANTAAILSFNSDFDTDIELRQSKYLNNIVEQDYRAIKRILRPMLVIKSFRSARALTAGIEALTPPRFHEHRHSAIGLFTVHQRHQQFDQALLTDRVAVYAAACDRHPR